MTAAKECFVISPIGEDGSDIRRRADQILKHVIRPAVEQKGYRAIRADEIDKPGIITSQVIQRVVDDPLVIADLTGRNPNVFYELAIRHAIRKPLVQIIQKGEAIPFDVASTRTISVNHKDLDSVDEAKRKIMDQITVLEDGKDEIETPISVSLDLQLLRQSDDPEDRSLADLVDAVAEIRTGLTRVESKIGSGDGEGSLDEIQSLIKALPRRIEDYVEFEASPMLGNGRRFRPEILLRVPRIAQDIGEPTLGVLIAASFFRTSIPWLYEVGVEAYRTARSNPRRAKQAITHFAQVLESTAHGPLGRELIGRSKRNYRFLEAAEFLSHELMMSADVTQNPLFPPDDEDNE